LPNLFRFLAFGFPLFTNYLRDVGIVEPRVVSDDRLLMMLPIKDKRYKEVSG
jgi:hypothetical protein